MTREEKIDWLCRLRADLNNGVLFTPWNKEFTEALNEALEQEPTTKDDHHKQNIQAYAHDFGVSEEQAEKELRVTPQEPRKGEWLRMSDLSEQEDYRYKCSRCGNVINHKSKMDLYTFNSWCGRCGSDNGRKIEVEG